MSDECETPNGVTVMAAIEFQAEVRNGSITIPEEHQDKFKGQVRVILLTENRTEACDLIEQLLANPLHIEGFKPLTREEIYEQR